MMNCKQATRLMSDAQERSLSFRERTALKMHNAICSGCRNFAKQMTLLRDMSRQYRQSKDED